MEAAVALGTKATTSAIAFCNVNIALAVIATPSGVLLPWRAITEKASKAAFSCSTGVADDIVSCVGFFERAG